MPNRTPEAGSTRVLIDLMKNGTTLDSLPDHRELPSLAALLNEWMGRRNLSTEALFEQACLNRATGFKVLAGKMMPSQNVLLRLALVMRLSIEETQWLLKCGHHAQLSGSRARDVLLMKAIIDGLPLDEADALLESHDQQPLTK
ncbi:MAG: helix-turn-helix transcriptional regulator [Clostridiales bacterium]|nr:helix-turn-helix transcriptional regulator [Clostridiales bacterium]